MSDLTLELGIICSSATTRSAQPSANVVVQFYVATTASGNQGMVWKGESREIAKYNRERSKLVEKHS